MYSAYRLTALLMGTTVVVAQPFYHVTASAAVSVGKLAEEVTVFIQGVNNPDNFGSGVIIGRSGKTYTVLTAAHVVDGSDQFTIKTSDGLGYNLKNVKKLAGADLAVVQFESSSTYTIASLGNSDQVSQTDSVFVAGYPKPGQNITIPVFTITNGDVSSIIRRKDQIQDGYALAYTNPTRAGMSGGPVLNSAGEVIAIHGRKEGEVGGGATNGAWLNLGIPINFYKAGGSGSSQVANNSDTADKQAKERAQQAALEAQQKAQQQAALEAQQKAQQQAALEAQQKAQQQAALESQQKAQQQAVLAAQQKAQQQAQQQATLEAQQKAQQQASSAKNTLLANVRPIDVIVPRSAASASSSSQQVCEEIRINTIVTKRCRTETVKGSPGGNESASANAPEAYVNSGNTRVASGSYRGALDDYTTAIQRNSNFAIAYFNRALAHYKLGDKTSAIADFTKAGDLFRAQGDSQKYQQTQDIIQALTQATS